MQKLWVGLAVGALLGCTTPVALPYSKVARELKPTPDGPVHLFGLAVADLSGDGFDDIIASAGPDDLPGPLLVFFNDGRGGFSEPPWRSDPSEDAYHGGVAVADVDRDGHLDVAVAAMSLHLGEGEVKIFFNRGSHGGGLERTAGFRTPTSDRFAPFGLAFGDANGDAWPDLAVAVFMIHPPDAGPSFGEQARIYLNRNGSMEEAPAWKATHGSASGWSVKFDDLDGNGWLGLAVGTLGALYYHGDPESDGGVAIGSDNPSVLGPDDVPVLFVDTAPRPRERDGVLMASHNLCDFEEVPSASIDGYVVARPPSSVWHSPTPGCNAGVALADLSSDGRAELVAGRWDNPSHEISGGPIRIFLGTKDGSFSSEAWESTSPVLAETVSLSDLDNGAREERVEVFQIETARRVLTLAGSGIQQVVSVQRGARVLDRSEFLWVPGGRWISFSQRLEPKERIVVRSFASDRPDIIVANYGLERAREGSVMIFDRLDSPFVQHPSRTVSPQTEEPR